MGRHAKDPVLFGLANKLKSSPFTQYPALNDEIEDRLKENDLRNVYLMKDGRTFAVKLWIAGASRIIGYTENLADAGRFADMARWQFAKYRVRDLREPVDSDLNFPVAQVKSDIESESRALALLTEVEKYLLEQDAIKAPTAKAEAARERRQTVRDDLNHRFADVESQFDALAEIFRMQISSVTAQLTRIEAALESFKRNRILREHVDTQDAEVVESGMPEQHTATKNPNVPTDDVNAPPKEFVAPIGVEQHPTFVAPIAVEQHPTFVAPIGAKDITNVKKPLVFLSEGEDTPSIVEEIFTVNHQTQTPQPNP